MTYLEYDQYLKTEITFAIGIIVVLFIVAIVAIGLLISGLKNNKRVVEEIVVASLTILIIIVLVIYCVPYMLDIHNKDYLIYSGKYFIEETIYGTGSDSVYIKTENEDNVKRYGIASNSLADGVHEGYFVYSKRTKVVFEMYCDECHGEK